MSSLSAKFLISGILAIHGYRKGSLSSDGALAAFFVGFTALQYSNPIPAALLTFYGSSHILTRILQNDVKSQPKRSYIQVMACAGPPTLYLLLGLISSFPREWDQRTWLTYLSWYAGSAGDTWASDIGTLLVPWMISRKIDKKPEIQSMSALEQPVLAWAPWKLVPKGTHGGISLIGTLASGLGGLTVALISIIFFDENFATGLGSSGIKDTILVGLFAGLLGSWLDSLIGSLFQASTVFDSKTKSSVRISGWDILSNEQVNLISSSLLSIITFFILPQV